MAASPKLLSVMVLVMASVAGTHGQTLAQQSHRVVNSRCDYAIEIALSDKYVAALVIERIRSHRMVLADVYCLPWPNAEGMHYVYFDFDCAPGMQCFWDPGILVVVDAKLGRVKIANEWYVPGSDLGLGEIKRMLGPDLRR
ncbi:MAG: hypothetical protein ACR2NP_19955 [Pirellulaceae bacterium]